MRSELSGSVPFSLRSPSSNRMAVRVDQHLAAADVVRLSHESVLLHALDQPRRAVVADAELALQVGGGGFLAFGNDLDSLAVELRFRVVFTGRLAVEKIASIFRFFGDRLIVVGRPLFAPMFGDRAHFLIADERAMDADNLLGARPV